MALKSLKLDLRRKPKRHFAPTMLESSFAEIAWEKSRHAATRWAVVGGVVGLLVGIVAFAPASWLAAAITSGTQQRLQLAEARGTIWSGSAVVVLTGGEGSRDASSLPGRLEWSLGLQGLGVQLKTRHACCLNGEVALQIKPGLSGMTVVVPPKPDWIGQWPAAFLTGLGTPFNTLRLGGVVRLSSPGLTLQTVQGRVLVEGRADIELLNVSSRMSSLETLGSYRMTLTGDPARAGGPSQLNLTTLEGALQLSGSGTVGQNGTRFRGEAQASEGNETTLSNLLNIIGRRDGARSVISIG
jgi:general secretion pathway protein N